ncbi:retinol-binding protein 4 [Latimeria chalumnae]|uniref:Retinol binding protein 4 n=1 Tax=Latimeria chalumnae TaxID=7897 RepID=H3BAJ5_LATCH|nr:PREDICTED: retinol-binding protein 4 [Latimeria chalumnae]XP_014341352.1 PREDICTED: retinol-binding protein 4 [Latimeria chalumnae]|eukprot:XP_005991620.1 PREDICTED: retinol-binding protein 4 [Latimeria chalumnae]
MGSQLLWGLGLAVACCLSFCLAEQDCRVSSIKVKENFDKNRYAGKWYAVAKKDPDGLFLKDDIVASFAVLENGRMSATATGLVTLLSGFTICVKMFGTFTDTDDSAKFLMKYWGAAANLQSGDDDHWIVDTDYDNYAIHYSCRKLNEDGTCNDSYSFIFSRDHNGLNEDTKKIVRKKMEELCLRGKYRLLRYNGECD